MTYHQAEQNGRVFGRIEGHAEALAALELLAASGLGSPLALRGVLECFQAGCDFADRIAPRVDDVEGANSLEVIRELIRDECHAVLAEIVETELAYERDGMGEDWRGCLDEVEVERRTKREVRELDAG